MSYLLSAAAPRLMQLSNRWRQLLLDDFVLAAEKEATGT
jgi:hypothetical protein